MTMKSSSLLILILIPLALLFSSCQSEPDRSWFRSAIVIPARGNSWVLNDPSKNEKVISDSGIVNWSDTGIVIRTFFRTENTSSLKVAARIRTGQGRSVINCSVSGLSKRIRISKPDFDTVTLGTFTIEKPGYNSIELKGSERSGEIFGDITDIFISGECTTGKVWYVKDDFYWGRRGPSVHLRYEIPTGAGDTKWFYNEITIPEGNDIEGSYFMANGFTDGYFGIQVNSEQERRVLFSVWSPYKTDNPRDILEDLRIILLRKGDSVHTGEFGNEGSGGQSYLKYMWKAGTKYGFLLKGEPSVNNSTDYTAWFYTPETGRWNLIASFRRPVGSRYLGSLYSFLENFLTETGDISRQGLYSNQWICNKSGTWTELTSARFTADATARKESRLDYSGGATEGSFILQNCGFFDNFSNIGTIFSRTPSGIKPQIDFSSLR